MNTLEWLRSLKLENLPILPNEGAMWCGHRSGEDLSNRFPWIVKELFQTFGFKSYVEIGIAQTGGLKLVHKYAPDDALIIGIDPLDKHPETLAVNNPIFKEQNVHLIRKRSDDAIDDLEDLLSGRELDFVNIDGDHTEKGSTNDFLNYFPLLRSGGLMWLDDIAHEPGVTKTWQKIKDRTIADWKYDLHHWSSGEIKGLTGIDGVWIIKQ